MSHEENEEGWGHPASYADEIAFVVLVVHRHGEKDDPYKFVRTDMLYGPSDELTLAECGWCVKHFGVSINTPLEAFKGKLFPDIHAFWERYYPSLSLTRPTSPWLIEPWDDPDE